MMEFLGWYNEFAKSNPIVASAFGVGLGGALLMYARSVPRQIFTLIWNQMVTSMILNNAGYGPNEEQCNAFMAWFAKQPMARFSRRLSMSSEWTGKPDPDIRIGAGFGLHFFAYKGRLFWFYRSRLESSGTHVEKFQIHIHGLTRNTKLLNQLVEEFRVRSDNKTVSVIPWDGLRWGEASEVTKRDLKTIVMNRELKKSIVGKIEEFFNSRKWYEDRGMPYKMCILLDGPPGTGKTSISKGLSSHFNKNIYTLNLANLTDDLLRKAVLSMPKGSVLLIEDFDTNKAVQNRSMKKLTDAERSQMTDGFTARGYVQCTSCEFIGIRSEDHFMWTDGRNYIGYPKGRPNDGWYSPIEDGSAVPSDVVERSPAQEMEPYFEMHDREQRGGDTSTADVPSRLTLSGLLNALDGIVPLDGSLIILTTNHPEQLDPALVRKGRIDESWTIPYLKDAEIRDYVDLMFPGVKFPKDAVFKDRPGCDVQAIFNDNRHCVDAFIKALLT